jgi:hypothetical protein
MKNMWLLFEEDFLLGQIVEMKKESLTASSGWHMLKKLMWILIRSIATFTCLSMRKRLSRQE